MAELELTHYEMLSLSAKYEEVSYIATGIWISIVSGFLIMSYTIGGNLTPRQSLFVSFLFVMFSLLVGFGVVGYAAASEYFLPFNFLSPDPQPFSILNTSKPLSIQHFWLTGGVFVILGSLLFLYDIRKRARNIEQAADEEKAANASDVAGEAE